MASLFKKKRDEEEMNIDLTPMLDVVFIMLIFFIVTATFVSEKGFTVNRPPPAPETDTPPPDAANAVFVVSETDEIWLGDRRIDLRSVRANVERIRAENPEASVVVRAHELSSASIYVGIVDYATEAIGTKLHFNSAFLTTDCNSLPYIRMPEKTFLLGVDTGGTFTDLCLVDPDGIRIHKVLSTPESPEKAILKGLDELGLKNKKENLYIVHGTTVATNAALENKGVKTAFITNKGFADILSIGRQARKELYNLRPQISQPPVATKLCLETAGRISAKGEVLHPLTEQDLDRLEQQIIALKPKAIAINLLFSFLNDKAEKRIEARLSQYAFTTRSSYILPEIREYERGIVTWYNAYLGPLIEDYLKRLKQAVSPAPVAIMQSSGGTIDIDQAAQKAVNLLLSGPAGGLAAGAYIGKLAKAEKILSFDMGGTSTDVALIEKEIKLTSEARIGHYPISIPMVDMHTIGAGGGSIAFQDAAGMLRVGPESAGAAPGPVCYGLGGQQPTVTDANAVLGRLQPDNFLGGTMSLDLNAARSSIGRLAKKLSLSTEECAAGIIELANEHMARALRVISEQRGHNPEEYQLMGFGGAGGLHICVIPLLLPN